MAQVCVGEVQTFRHLEMVEDEEWWTSLVTPDLLMGGGISGTHKHTYTWAHTCSHIHTYTPEGKREQGIRRLVA